jgi:hypothetical protein
MEGEFFQGEEVVATVSHNQPPTYVFYLFVFLDDEPVGDFVVVFTQLNLQNCFSTCFDFASHLFVSVRVKFCYFYIYACDGETIYCFHYFCAFLFVVLDYIFF